MSGFNNIPEKNKIFAEESFNKHVIKEEDLKDKGSGAEYHSGFSNMDVYNSEINVKEKFFKKDFLRFFRIPLIIIVFLISVVIVLKFIFFHKANTVKTKKIMVKTALMPDKKRFSPAVFNYAEKNAAAGKVNENDIKIKKPDKFNNNFKQETEKLNRGIKFNNGQTANQNIPSEQAAQFSKKTVVFIEASYGKYILNLEKGAVKRPFNKLYNIAIEQKKSPTESLNGNGIAIPQGTVVEAYTKYKIFSYNISVPVIAVSSSGFYINGKTVFKKGDKFLGTVSVKHSLNRLNITFDKIIESSGKAINIDAIAMMPDGSGGVKGKVEKHYAGSILTSIAQGVAGAASIFAGGGSGINSSNPYTFQNQVRENVAQNEIDSAQNGLNNYAELNHNASITLPAGTPVKIIFLKPVYLNRIK